MAEELYDHTGDNGGDFDTFPLNQLNLASSTNPVHVAARARLEEALQAGWEAAVPPVQHKRHSHH